MKHRQKKKTNQIYLALCWMAALSLWVACAKKNNEEKILSSLKYAKGFSIKIINDDAKLVTVGYPYQGATSGYEYLLVRAGRPVPAHEKNVPVIFIPVQSVVCTSTTHIPLLDYLDETNKLVGFPTTDYISSEKMRKRIEAGLVTDLGIDKGMDIEKLVSLKPSLVMGYTMSADWGQLKKIQALGIPVVINAEYLEEHPLGRAEWIKFMALFLDKEKKADSVFNLIESEYLATKKSIADTVHKPTVMSGIMYGDAWFMPGGKNYAAQLLNDAGCLYLWGDTPANGFLQMGFESVYIKAKNAEMWIGASNFNSLAEMTKANPRYGLFDSFKNKKVFTYHARVGAKGGSEFLELGYLRPDLILKDLVKIAHPELLPGYSMFFYKKLE
ncbi:MAG: ABC transporter substrate-binding protein [Bacteroidetes bacterium]|nr:ABC transporter substrate-binding protein [Bacteroidota bacterium]